MTEGVKSIDREVQCRERTRSYLKRLDRDDERHTALVSPWTRRAGRTAEPRTTEYEAELWHSHVLLLGPANREQSHGL